MTTKTRRKDRSTVLKSVTLLTSVQEKHQHSIRIHPFDLEDGNLGGETSHATGDAATEEAHNHPWLMDDEGNMRIGEVDGHSHDVDEMELGRALAQLRASMARVEMSRTETPDEDEIEKNPSGREARRRLTNGEIHTVSLCRRGVNGVRSLLKSVDGNRAQFALTTSIAKMDNEGLLHTLVYVPDMVDHERDVMSGDEIRKTAHGFLRNGGNIDIEHDGRPLSVNDVHIAEHYIVPQGDPKFAGITDDQGNAIDPTGAWGLILKIHDPDLLAGYELGEWIGVSMAGRAEVEVIGKSRPLDPPTEDDLNMTPEERKAFAEEIAKATATAVAEAIKPSQNEQSAEQAESHSPELPAPPEDLNDPVALEKYADDLFVAGLDMSKPADVAKLIKHRKDQATKAAKLAAEEAAEVAKSEAKTEGAEETELEKAQRERDEANARVEKIEKSSRQSGKDTDEDEDDEADIGNVRGLKKSEKSGYALGRKMAERWNKTQRRVGV